MLKPSTKGLFVELSEYSLLAARTSRLKPPFTIEAVEECTLTDDKQIDNWLGNFMGLNKGQFCIGVCGVYPPNRLIRRASLENPARAKDPAFLPDYLKQQFKVDVATHSVAVLNAAGGSEFNITKGFSRELVFCGAPTSEFQTLQDRLVSFGIYPERIELSTVSLLGGLVSYSELKERTAPTMVLEIASENAQVLIYQGNQLDVARPIPYGLNSMYPIVQKELGLKDEASARKLFTSNTFDFTEMGGVLLKKLLKELQASTGFYEVQTGQTIGEIFLSLLPDNLNWIGSTLSRTLGVDVLVPEYGDWLQSHSIEVSDSVDLLNLGSRWFGLFSLMGNFNENIEHNKKK